MPPRRQANLPRTSGRGLREPGAEAVPDGGETPDQAPASPGRTFLTNSVNTGPNYDPDGMKPVPAGSYVTHFGKEIHYDGAKDTECVLLIVGMGPATNTPAAAPAK